MSAVALIVALAALAAAALCAAADAALLTAAERRTGDGREVATGGMRDHAHRALGVARLLAQLGAGFAGALATSLDARPPFAAALQAIGIALVVLVLGELAPRAAGTALGERALRALAPFVTGIEAITAPITRAGIALDRALRKLLPPARARDADRDVTADQFRQVVQAEAEVHGARGTILHRIFSLSDTEVHEVMVPRVDMAGVELGTPWADVLARARSAEHARLPVFDETPDHVTGVLFAKDLLSGVIADAEPPGGWEALVRPASFIPESKPIDIQLRDFKASGQHIAIVVDEFGGTAGLITIEDILEEIVGDIRDERDQEEEPIRSEGGTRFWVSGRVTLDELSDALGQSFGREDVSTVGGLIFELVGHVPRAGQELEINGFRVVVERVVRRRVDRVYFERHDALAERAS